MHDMVESPIALSSIITEELVFLWYFICLVSVYKTIHRVGLLKGLAIGVLGVGLWITLTTVLEVPVVQMMWKAYKLEPHS